MYFCSGKFPDGPRGPSSMAIFYDLRKMQRHAIAHLAHLLAATKSIRNNQRVARGFANIWQQNPLCTSQRDIEMFLLKAKRACHAATAGVRAFELQSHFFQQYFLAVEIQHGFLMAMAVHDCRPLKFWQFIVRRVFLQKFRECERLFAKPASILILWKQLDQFVSENGCAAWLKSDHRRSRLNFRFQLTQNLPKPAPSCVQHSVII